MNGPPNETLLMMTLSAAVPLWQHEFAKLPLDVVNRIAGECAQVIAEKGDVLQFGGGKKGEAANAFNALAKGLAALSFCPGGVKFNGEKWETHHPQGKPPAPKKRVVRIIKRRRT